VPEYTVEIRAWSWVEADSQEEALDLADQLVDSLDLQDLEVVDVQLTKYLDPKEQA
jgi:hypothetical protein